MRSNSTFTVVPVFVTVTCIVLSAIVSNASSHFHSQRTSPIRVADTFIEPSPDNCPPDCYFGWLDGPNNNHLGYDYSSPAGTEVRAISHGVVHETAHIRAKCYDRNTGDELSQLFVWIKHRLHTGRYFYALYGHVEPFERVTPDIGAGEKIGKITECYVRYRGKLVPAPHLHFGIWDSESLPPSSNVGYGPVGEFTNPKHFLRKNKPFVVKGDRAPSALATALVLDISGSMSEPSGRREQPGERKIDAAIKDVLSYVEKLDSADYASLNTFSAGAQTVVSLSPQPESAKKIFEIAPRLSPQTSTNMADGLRLGYEELAAERDSARKGPLVLAIDGVDWLASAACAVPGVKQERRWRGDPAYLSRAFENSSRLRRIQARFEPFPWFGDIEETRDTVDKLKTFIRFIGVKIAKHEGRPLVVVAHSWGGVLAYQALHELEGEITPRDVALFLTLGSPLNAQFLTRPWWQMSGLERVIRRCAEEELARVSRPLTTPSAVNVWMNFWTERDFISGPIPGWPNCPTQEWDRTCNWQLPSARVLLDDAIRAIRAHLSYYRDPSLEIVAGEVAVAHAKQARAADIGVGRRLAILLSDGIHNAGPWSNVVDMAKRFAERGWRIYTFGYGEDVDEDKLREVAALTGGLYWPGDAEIGKGAFVDIRYDASGRSGILRHSEKLQPSGELRYRVPISAGAESMQVDTSWPGSRLETSLVSPSGRSVRGRDLVGQTGRYVLGASYEMLEIPRPEPGMWEIQIRWAEPPATAERVIVSVSEKTDIVANMLGVKSSYQAGNRVLIGVRIAETTLTQDIPLRNARVVAKIRKPGPEIVQAAEAGTGSWAMYKDVVQNHTRELVLHDDGQHQDYSPGDGVYANTFSETTDNGPYVVTIEISGFSQNGQKAAKTLQGSFQVGPILLNRITISRELDWLEKLASGAQDLRSTVEDRPQRPEKETVNLLEQPTKEIDNLLSDPKRQIDDLLGK